MAIRSAVAVYARISRDPSGDMLGVTRQLEDCRAEATRRGWQVAQEYVDDDTSAYSGAARPEYERMMRDIAAGSRDAVIVYRMDRLHRRPIELEEFVQVCQRAGMTDVVSLQGEYDMAKSDGLFVARLMANVAAHESHVKSERIRRKTLQNAETGKPYMGGGFRPFGYQEDRATPYEPEAAMFREAAERVLAGQSLNSVARLIRERGFTGTAGSPITQTTLRTMLLRPRNYGMRVHQGEVIGSGTWEPLISPEDGERLRLLLTDPARRKNRTARRYLLSGMLVCGTCGAQMHSRPRGGTRRYACGIINARNTEPCQSIYIDGNRVEELIVGAVLELLDSPQMSKALTGGSDDEQVARMSAEITADTAQMDDLAAMFADREISREEWKKARDRIEARVEINRKTLARLTDRDALEDYIGQGDQLRTRWASLDLSEQQAVVKAVIDHAVIHPYDRKPGLTGFDPSRVVPVWRV